MKLAITGQKIIGYVLLCIGAARSLMDGDGFQPLVLGWLVLIRAEAIEMGGKE